MESTPIGMVSTLARTRMCDISAFRHHTGRTHRDPAVEQTGAPELILTTRGDWTVRTSASSGGVTVDCLVAIDAEQELQIRHDDREPRDAQLMITLKSALVDALRDFHQHDRLFGLSHCGMTTAIDATRRLLLDELAHDRPGRNLAIDNHVSALAIEALRAGRRGGLSEASNGQAAFVGSTHSRRLQEARDYVEGHLDHDIDLGELASHAHLSPGHFARLFRAQYGLSPRDYLLRARMRQAAELIDAGVDLRAAAAQVGIHSASHFRAGFRRCLGMAPSQWQARLQR